jgi:hypothetical protein
MKYLIVLVAIVSIAVGCKRKGEPFPRICSNKEVYKMGDTIKVSNCSDRYTKQRWLMPDNTQSTADYAYFVPLSSDSFTFRLYVTDENFVQEYEAIKTLYVAP